MLVYNTLFSRILQEGNAYFLEKFYRGGTRRFPALVDRGIRTAAGGFGPNGRHLFLPRRTGVLELPQAGSPFPGGKFSAEPQRGDSPSADGGSVPRPAAGAKRKDNLRFSFLFELLPFPCLLARRRFPICDRSEKEERQSGYHSVSFTKYSQFADSVLLHISESLRRGRHGYAAQRLRLRLQCGTRCLTQKRRP